MRRASPAGSSHGTGAPNTHRAASPSNLFTIAPSASTTSTTTRKKRLSRRTTSVGGMASAIDVEPTMSTNSAPTWRSSPPRRVVPSVERLARDVLAHLAAEQVADALALAQAVGHPVEAGLEQADLAAVVDRHVHVELAVLDPLERAAHRDDGMGDRLRRVHRGQQPGGRWPPRRGRGSRRPGTRCPRRTSRARRRPPRSPRAAARRCPSAQAPNRRPRTPGAIMPLGWRAASASAVTGRSARSEAR